jgi:hypothetical protein
MKVCIIFILKWQVYYATVKDALYLINAVAMELQENTKQSIGTDVILETTKNVRKFYI